MVTSLAEMLESKLRPLLTEHQRERVKAILAEQETPSFAWAIRTLYQELAEENPALATALVNLMVTSITGGPEDPKREEERQKNRVNVDRLDNVEPQSRYYRLRTLGAWTPQESLDACGLLSSNMSAFAAFKLRGDLPRLAEALAAVQTWIVGTVAICTLSGPPGCGKTHLLTAAVRDLVDRAEYVRYLDERDLIDQSRRAIRDHTVEEFKYDLCNVPRLVLDDLGASSASDYDRSVLDEIIDERWTNRRSTLVATNLTSAQLPARLVSRLGDVKWCVQVSIAAPDGRRDRWYDAPTG